MSSERVRFLPPIAAARRRDLAIAAGLVAAGTYLGENAAYPITALLSLAALGRGTAAGRGEPRRERA